MTNSTHLIIAGVGPGSPGLVTFSAFREASASDLILVPRSKKDQRGIAEKIIRRHLHMSLRKIIPLVFPMTSNVKRRDKIILSQLEAIKPKILSARKIFFPVIGDSVLYSTGAYLAEALKTITPLEVSFIPGVSAHSMASSCAKRFLAMSDEILTIIPGTASPEKISAALEHSDSVAIYKPSAIHDIRKLIDPEKFSTILRVDFAGIVGREKIFEGIYALEGIDEYLSVILLKR